MNLNTDDSNTQNNTQQVDPIGAIHIIKQTDNYFVAHFNGDISLGYSYWINNMLIAGFVVPMSIVLWLLAFSDLIGLISVVIAGAFGLASYVWAWLGLWRSANKHQSRGGKRFWAIAAKIIVVISIVCTLIQVIVAI